MAFIELKGQALRDFDSQRAAGLNPKPAGVIAPNTERPAAPFGAQPAKPNSYGLKAVAPAIAPGFGGVSNDITPKFGGDGKAYAPGYAPAQKPAHEQGPGLFTYGGDRMNAPAPTQTQAIAPAGMGGALQATQAGIDANIQKIIGEFGGNAAAAQAYTQMVRQVPAGIPPQVWDQIVREQIQAQLPAQVAKVEAKANPLAAAKQGLTGPSPYANLTVDWGRVQRDQTSQMLAGIGEQRAAQEKAARENAARRGLTAGGNSALAQGQLARIGENAANLAQRGGLDIATNISNQARDYDMRLAGADAAWRMGVPAALINLEMAPHNLMNADLQNKMLETQGSAASFRLEEDRAVAPHVREATRLDLERLRAQIRQAEQTGNLALATQLGTAAANIAKNGGFKLIGGGVGLIGGPAGSAVGAGAGAWLDSLLGGK